MAERICPMLKGACAEHGCRWYVQLMGVHPQTGAPLGEWGCAVEWLPVLLVENAKETRQTAAAIESARNAAREDTRSQAAVLLEVANAVATQERSINPAIEPSAPRRLNGGSKRD